MLIGVSAAETVQDCNLTIRSEGRVSGEGYFAARTYLMMPLGVEAKSYGHGSGRIYAERQLLAQSSSHSSPDDNCTEDDYLYDNTSYSSIWMKEDRKITSGPLVMAQGKGYFSDHPLTFQLPVTDVTSITNRDDSNSMHHTIAYSRALAGELEVSIEDYLSESEVQTLNTMKVAENVTAGMTHIGINQLDIDEGADAVMVEEDDMEDDDLVFEMDETYAGTFQIALTAILPDDEDDDEEDDEDDDNNEEKDYLQCCNGSQNAAFQDESDCGQGGPLSGNNVTQELDQIVRGEGYFSAHQYLETPDDLRIEGFGHGSGTIERKWQFLGQNDDNCSLIECLNNNSPDCIIRDHSQMNFNPTIMAMSKGYYADHPLTYKSLSNDATWIKDSVNANSMSHEVKYAHGLSKELGIAIYDIEDDDDDEDDEAHNQGCNATAEPNDRDEITTIMNLSEKVIEGRAYSAFVLSNYPDDEDNGDNNADSIYETIQVDEEYMGTFSIVQNMTFTTPDADYDEDGDGDDEGEDTRPPCFNCGYWNANLYDCCERFQNCIFDCNCTEPKKIDQNNTVWPNAI